ncbi:MAG: hypothetical protein ACTS80_01585 [Candidatus Hodgkinia cicadicola]
MLSTLRTPPQVWAFAEARRNDRRGSPMFAQHANVRRRTSAERITTETSRGGRHFVLQLSRLNVNANDPPCAAAASSVDGFRRPKLRSITFETPAKVERVSFGPTWP